MSPPLGWENRHTSPVHSGVYHDGISDVKRKRSLYHVGEEFVWQVIETGSGGKRWWDIRLTRGRPINEL